MTMMKGRIIGIDASEWTTPREATEHDVYDTPGYAGLAAWQEGGVPAGLFVDAGDSGRLLIPIVDLRDRREPPRCSVADGDPGILTDRRGDAAFVRDAMATAISTLQDEGLVSLFVRLHPLVPLAGLEDVGELVRHKTVAVDLSPSMEQIWAETRDNYRRESVARNSKGRPSRSMVLRRHIRRSSVSTRPR